MKAEHFIFINNLKCALQKSPVNGKFTNVNGVSLEGVNITKTCVSIYSKKCKLGVKWLHCKAGVVIANFSYCVYPLFVAKQ